ncbi:MAG: hypothetical protein K8S94_02175 [Planctomycetia bacterium]|nr:hypothetical protein [Planctomycetia bacterium]
MFHVEQSIRAAVPEIVFASPRMVRRIIRAQHELPLGLARLPHRDIAIMSTRRLASLTDDVLAFPADLPDTVAVVARPDAERFETADVQPLLREYWRLCFHALLDLASRRLLDDPAEAAAARQRIATWLGPTSAEAATVLVQEGLLRPGADQRETFAEFIAVFLELRCFAPDSVWAWFPSIDDPDGLAGRLSELIGAEDLLDRALPDGHDPDAVPQSPPQERPASFRWPEWFRPRPAALRRQADRTALRGNMVRAALDEWRAASARPEGARPATGRLDRQIDAFARRLGWALDLDAATIDDAAEVIRGLVERTGGSSWTPQARLLYDLQKICVDSERESFRTQLLGWLFSLGKRPLATPLPCQRLVLIHRHAVDAAARVPAVGLTEPLRRRADRLMRVALETTDAAARETLRPRVETAIHDAGLIPGCLVEEAALDKLVDELLDGITERGFVSFGSVRDAISRNQLKLPDLRGPGQWLAGDQLLELDDRLAASLDGVYRQAPVYLAAMQRLSAPFFGVSVGRLITTHVLLPFGGAWIILRGLEHVIEPITEYSLGEMWHVYTRGRMLAVGIALWALIHLPAVRVAAIQALRGIVAAVHFVVIGLPGRLLRLPVFERIVRSPPVRWFIRHAWSPLVVTLLVWLLLPYDSRWISRQTPWVAPLVFAASAVLLNSRFGRQMQEQVVETAGRALHQFHLHVIVGLFAWIIDAFRRAVDFIEGTLYAVDESLRFRSDESGLMLAVKAVLGAGWSIIEAFVRFCITLLIEPQLNPIKHFPVVTVSHKLLVPMIPVVASQLVAATGMEKGMALTAVTFVSTCIPGVFGFLAWELKENWRLYAANRSTTLRPVQVGHHGETMRRLLAPGFHSGTIPRLFARLRRTHGRDPAQRRSATRMRRLEHQIHELERDIAAFVERDAFGLVERTDAGRDLALRVTAVRLAVGRIEIAIDSAAIEAGSLILALVEDEGRIDSRVVSDGWLGRVRADQQVAVRLAIAGFHRLAAADEATAGYAEMPGGTSDLGVGRPVDALVPVTPLAWLAWRDAWERQTRRA